mgnify:FL=1
MNYTVQVEAMHTDVLTTELWQRHLDIVICIHELLDSILLAALRRVCNGDKNFYKDSRRLVSRLDMERVLMQADIMKSGSSICPDSQNEGLLFHQNFTSHVMSAQKTAEHFGHLDQLVADAKECTNVLRYLCEQSTVEKLACNPTATVLKCEGSKFVKTYQGYDIEEPGDTHANALGRLKRDFDKQCLNILALERERNQMAIEIIRQRQAAEKCGCHGVDKIKNGKSISPRK